MALQEFQELLERARQVGNKVVTTDVKQRMAATAEALSYAGQMQAHLEICLAATAALIDILYTLDEDGQPANFDRQTERIFLDVPWGDKGYRVWGLRKSEAICFRRLLQARQSQTRRLPFLFYFADYTGRWHLNIGEYPTHAAALEWLRKDGPKLAEWRTMVTEWRDKEAARMRKRRGIEE
jgi:hypothetical protein